MHFHHRHDADGCVNPHDDWPEPHRVMLATLDRLESLTMTMQEQIDGLTADVKASTEAIAAKTIDTPDLSGLTAAVADLKAAAGVDAPAPAPVVPVEAPVAPVADGPAAPVDVPAAPVVTEPAPADSTVIA